jgi:hypothetical protein
MASNSTPFSNPTYFPTWPSQEELREQKLKDFLGRDPNNLLSPVEQERRQKRKSEPQEKPFREIAMRKDSQLSLIFYYSSPNSSGYYQNSYYPTEYTATEHPFEDYFILVKFYWDQPAPTSPENSQPRMQPIFFGINGALSKSPPSEPNGSLYYLYHSQSPHKQKIFSLNTIAVYRAILEVKQSFPLPIREKVLDLKSYLRNINGTE